MRPRRPLGAAIFETVATFAGSREARRRCVLRRSPRELAVPLGGGCDLRNRRLFRGLLEGPEG
eukprot:8502311-Pyramimonas_sp.AAC.1